MKMAIVTGNLDWAFIGGAKGGGGSVVLKNIIIELNKIKNIDLTIYCTNSNINNFDNIKIVKVNFDKNSDAFSNFISNEITKNKYSKIITINIEKILKNQILQSHTYRHRCHSMPLGLRWIKTLLSIKKIKIQDSFFKGKSNEKYIVMSKKLKNDYEKTYKISSQNINVAYPGCTINEQLKNKVKAQNNTITFGVISNSSMNKGGYYLLFVLGLLKIFNFKFNIKVIVKNPRKDLAIRFLIKIFSLKSNVELLKQSDNLDSYYNSIDCLVLPSMNEALGLVVLEAMSNKIPCLVSSTAGVSEIIDFNNGFIFNRKSIADLIKKLIEIEQIYSMEFNKYINIGNEAYKTSENYTWNKFVKKILEYS